MVDRVELERPLPVSFSYLTENASPQKRRRVGDSSIEEARAVEVPYTPSKPTLDRPLPALETLRQAKRIEDVGNQHSLQQEKRIDERMQKIQKLHEEEARKLEEAYEASKDASFWGLLEDIGSTIMSSVSFFFGAAALSSGGAAVGGALIVSGVASLSHIAFKYTNAWDWISDQVAGENKELKETIRTYLPPALGITAAALGLYGAYGAWNFVGGTGLQQAFSVLQTSGHVAHGLTTFSNGRATSFYQRSSAEVSALQSMSELVRLDVENCIEELKGFHENLLAINEQAARLIEETDQAIQITQQPV